MRAFKSPVAHFVGHLCIGTTLFLLFGGICVVLGLIGQYLEGMNLPAFTLQTLLFVEHVIMVVDTVLYLCLIVYSAFGFIKEIIK